MARSTAALQKVSQTLGSTRGFFCLTSLCLAEALGSICGLMPQIAPTKQQAQVLLPAGFATVTRAALLLMIAASLRGSRASRAEEALRHMPRLVGWLCPCSSAVLSGYWLALAITKSYESQFVVAMCGFLSGVNGCLVFALRVCLRRLLAVAQDQPTAKLYALYDGTQKLGDDVSCSICLADMKDGETVGELPCGHVFHGSCINEWLTVRPRCPLRCEGFIYPSAAHSAAQVYGVPADAASDPGVSARGSQSGTQQVSPRSPTGGLAAAEPPGVVPSPPANRPPRSNGDHEEGLFYIVPVAATPPSPLALSTVPNHPRAPAE